MNEKKIEEDLLKEGLIKETELFTSILAGRLKGFTPDNCPHPFRLKDGHFYICTQCGHSEMS